MHKTAFFTVVYPGIEKYFKDFASSLCRQTDKSFDLIIFNESNTEIDFKSLLEGIQYKVIPTDPATPIIIRERGFAYLRQHHYQYVIFGDADDWFSDNRVAKSVALLEKYALVINDVDIVTDKETLISHYFSHRLKNRTSILENDILYGNFMGLSAAAIQLEALPEFTTPKDIVALDWYMFSLMIHEKKSAVFTNEMTTYYRQYDSNLVGMKQITLDSLKREILVKFAHYKALKPYSAAYEILMNNFAELTKSTENKEDLKLLYSKIKDNTISYPFWWENTKNGLL